MAFRFIATNLHPDHDTLANFRKTFLVELNDLFVQVLAYAQTMKQLKLGKISLDGTKIKAAETDQQAAEDDHYLPAEIARREQRLQALADAKANIAQRDQQARQDYADKVARREAQREAGQKPRGKEPNAPETGPKDAD